MDFKQPRALVTVAEVGSVTRAAELLHLVQPAVTRQIKALEAELGVPLFDRTWQGMRPTEAGVTMAERARRALTELDRARAEVAPARGAVTGIVTLGLLESAAGLIAEPLTSAVLRAHPGIELRLQTGYSGHLRRWLDEGDLDVSLLYDITDSPSLTVTPVVRERLWVLAPPAAGLDPQRPVSFARIARDPLVLPSPGHGLRSLIDTAARQAGAELIPSVQTNSMPLQKRLVLAGHGWTILPGVGIAGDIAAGRLTGAPVREPEVWRSIAVARPRSGRVPPAVDVVARELLCQVRAAVADGRWPSAEPLIGDGGR
ncbi:LysR family transcriptional regulator [Amycolatopsis granulosa]|uniref:LysR family transcriptional regulator n=1 Tax=Amycolatopsis granulosa TaxID=185684 RepID=UPI0014227984|nr:LysR family transcriptional regulator [Amycolatopsis granulosa]NIH83663.1 DNA-binding transcriptional LysR family regulator [Amycolatopsis granulosa]